MTFDGYTAADLRVMHAQAAARADIAHYHAAAITFEQLHLAGDDAAWHALEATWQVLMAAGDEAAEMMEAITGELERRTDEREAARRER